MSVEEAGMLLWLSLVWGRAAVYFPRLRLFVLVSRWETPPTLNNMVFHSFSLKDVLNTHKIIPLTPQGARNILLLHRALGTSPTPYGVS
jgi:hypothetical protein